MMWSLLSGKASFVIAAVILSFLVGSHTWAWNAGKNSLKSEMEQNTAKANQRAEELLVENNRIRQELARANRKTVNEYVATTVNRECLDPAGVELFNLTD